VLARAREIAVRHGVHHVYTGNVHDRAGQSTYCSGCDAMLIGRDWYELSEWNLSDDGHCRSCGTRCPGVFEGPAGTWGSRRMPVRLAKASGKQE
jgi:pyruvate formate lyase activating enzyme